MTILIIYESIEGQTAKITKFVQAMLIRLGNEVSTADTSDPMLQISFENVDRVVLAAPVHERRCHCTLISQILWIGRTIVGFCTLNSNISTDYTASDQSALRAA